MLNKPEILAPAGSMEALHAAVNAGADAVYLGGSLFSARAFASNFDTTELLKAIDYCHIHNIKLYMAVNTLLKNTEISGLYDYILPFYREGVDGIIVQDMGVAGVLGRCFPDLPLHGSTQLSVSSEYGATLLKDMGFTRFVPSRELSLREIKDIRSAVDIELETFVHGAMCFAYSGKCLFSSFAGGRSGNRGRCAGPCRKQYSVEGEKADYALSMKDMCTLSILPELIDTGIDSFKIEGRMKKPEYVAATANAYRNIRDLYLSGNLHNKDIEMENYRLLDIYNRGGFISGYYHMHNGNEMLSLDRPNHTGVEVGTVVGVNAPEVDITLKADVNKGDVLEIRTPSGNIELTLNVTGAAGKNISIKGKELKHIKRGQRVFRTRNNVLIDQINKELINSDKTVSAGCYFYGEVGAPFTVNLSIPEYDIYVDVTGDIVQPANNKPVTAGQLKERLGKTGNTGFVFNDIEGYVSDNAFLPVSVINDVRRRGIELLEKELVKRFMREQVPEQMDDRAEQEETRLADIKQEKIRLAHMEQENNGPHDIKLKKNELADEKRYVYVRTLEQLKSVAAMAFNGVIFVDHGIVPVSVRFMNGLSEKELSENGLSEDEPAENKPELGIALPEVLRQDKLKAMEELDRYMDSFAYVLVRNMDEILYVKKHYLNKKIILDSSIYCYNNEAVDYYRIVMPEFMIVSSAELTLSELNGINAPVIYKEYGHDKLMITAQCMNKCHRGGECFKEKLIPLRDELGNDFYAVNHCDYCYNIIYNGRPAYIADLLSEKTPGNQAGELAEFTVEDGRETLRLCNALGFTGEGPDQEFFRDLKYTRGHFVRGID